MNIAANPHISADQTVYLKDYQQPSFLVDSINLDIQIHDDHTHVFSTLVMKRNAVVIWYYWGVILNWYRLN